MAFRAGFLHDTRKLNLSIRGRTVEIYLTKSSGQKEGPFSLAEINRQLAARSYTDTDYWAWYSGLTDWVPLYNVPGIVSIDETAFWVAEEEPPPPGTLGAEEEKLVAVATAGGITAAAPDLAEAAAETAIAPEPVAPPAEPDAAAPPSRQFSSGLPFAALEQIFILTTGDGPTASRSDVTLRLLEETVGQPATLIRDQTSRDAIGQCRFIEQLRANTPMPPDAWRAMANFKTQLVQDARDRLYKICVRTFPIENGDLVCVFLFYNKQKL